MNNSSKCTKYDVFFASDTNECASNPCQNGAECDDEVNRYTCECKPGYVGTNCETGEKIGRSIKEIAKHY